MALITTPTDCSGPPIRPLVCVTLVGVGPTRGGLVERHASGDDSGPARVLAAGHRVLALLAVWEAEVAAPDGGSLFVPAPSAVVRAWAGRGRRDGRPRDTLLKTAIAYVCRWCSGVGSAGVQLRRSCRVLHLRGRAVRVPRSWGSVDRAPDRFGTPGDLSATSTGSSRSWCGEAGGVPTSIARSSAGPRVRGQSRGSSTEGSAPASSRPCCRDADGTSSACGVRVVEMFAGILGGARLNSLANGFRRELSRDPHWSRRVYRIVLGLDALNERLSRGRARSGFDTGQGRSARSATQPFED